MLLLQCIHIEQSHVELIRCKYLISCYSFCVLQSHNQILKAAASGDVTALRCVATQMGPVPLTNVQNEV